MFTCQQEFIRFYQDKSSDLFSAYLEQALRLFSQQKNFFQHQWKNYHQLFSDPAVWQQMMLKTSTSSVSAANKKPNKKNPAL